MDCFLIPSLTTYPTLSLLRDIDFPGKENISPKNSAEMDDDRKAMGAYHVQQIMIPSTCTTNNNGDMPPSSTNNNGVNGSSGLIHDGDDDSTHGSSPKLPLYDHSEVMRPVALRPSTLKPSNRSTFTVNLGFPSLQVALDDEPNLRPNQSHSAGSRVRRIKPINIPQLRSRPALSKRELKISSPLARRGAAERAYLQGQLKAEAHLRRKRERLNEQRKISDSKGIGDDKIQFMVDRFKSGFGGMGPPDKKSSPPDISDFGSSPPTVLKSTFKRSVSAVLDDSGLDENCNLLFFPDGLPLLNEDEENSLHEVAEGTVAGSETPDSLQEVGKGDDRGVNFSEGRSLPISQLSSPADENSPSLIPAGDLIWQLGAISPPKVPSDLSMPSHKGNKKVTLRPKMNAHKNCITNSDPHPLRSSEPWFESVDGCEISSGVYPDAQTKSVGRLDACINDSGLISNEDNNAFEFKLPDKSCVADHSILSASASFRLLQKESEEGSEHIQHVKSDTKAPFLFSSPEAGIKQTFRDETGSSVFLLKGPLSESHLILKEPLSESNCFTPDNSERIQSSRSQLGARMTKLPELGMPVFDSNVQQNFQGKASMALLDDRFGKEVAYTPELAARDLLLKEPPQASANDFILKEPLSESNYCTPDNSEHMHSSRKHLGVRMQKLPELGMPMFDSNAPTKFEEKSHITLFDAVVGGEGAFTPKLAASDLSLNKMPPARVHDFILKEPLSESNYCTPDKSEHRHFSHRHSARMPKLPELGLPITEYVASMALVGASEGYPGIISSGLSLKEPFSESDFSTPDRHF